MVVRLLLLLLLPLLGLRGQDVSVWVERHAAALGGLAQVRALAALRAAGRVESGGRSVRFHLTAARPAAVRIETERGGRTLVQAADGREPPWEFDTGQWPPRYREMPPAVARAFAADAEFDDPLVAGPERGFVLEDGGEVEVEGVRLRRILVTRRGVESFFVFLDPRNAHLVMRLEERTTLAGRKTRIVTRYEDLRPVGGVWLPHRIVQLVDGTPRQTTVILEVEPNPLIDAGMFTRPRIQAP